MAATQLSLVAAAGVNPVDLDQANTLLVEWGHYLGACERPFATQCWVLDDGYRPVSVAVAASIVSATVAGYDRAEVVELARLCSAPDARWATRPMLRLWREICAPRWHRPLGDPRPPLAAVAYSQNARHNGTIYRFDGWTKVSDRCGGNAGPNATWTKQRASDHPARGDKTLWAWRYTQDEQEVA